MKQAFPKHQFLDIHSHLSPEEGVFRLRNFFLSEKPAYPASLGYHPMHIRGDWKVSFLKNAAKFSDSEVLLIGECGFDKRYAQYFTEQSQAFEWQLQLALELQKPMVLHMVKGWGQLNAVLAKFEELPHLLVHGFRAKLPLAHQLLQRGFYLSFGEALLRDNHLQQCFAQTPIDRIFLETDEANIDIKQLYQTAATLLKLNVSDLQGQIWENFERLLG
ncbi:TatD family hydrolase [Persicobacter diffluens]|uniref:TatD family hydrolase n=1 Tax=Persicobacter diffluens TaxID=981 RepID=A0AAN5AL46_9BACT|nr:TatD family hydrolase [Persicobacter diffluens]